MITIQHRRWIGRLIKVGLLGLAVVVVFAFLRRKSPVRGDLRLDANPPVAGAALGTGDLRIYNRDSSVNLILQGDRILAGLSPQTVERVRRELESSTADDTGLGGSIAQIVKRSVAGSIGTHVVYPVRDIREIEYRDGQIVIVRHDGSATRLLGSVKTGETEAGKTFRPDDAQRFVEAVRARKRQLEAGGT